MISIILPTLIGMSKTTQMKINGWPINDAKIYPGAHTITGTIYEDGIKEFIIVVEKGLQNPEVGPYTYNQFNIEFNTK